MLVQLAIFTLGFKIPVSYYLFLHSCPTSKHQRDVIDWCVSSQTKEEVHLCQTSLTLMFHTSGSISAFFQASMFLRQSLVSGQSCPCLKSQHWPRLVWLGWLNAVLVSKAHTQVAGSAPWSGHKQEAADQCFSLSLSFALSVPLLFLKHVFG